MNSQLTTPKGKCIVCGSGLLMGFWRGHPDNRKVHCNDCGSEVTEWMHNKKQPLQTDKLTPSKETERVKTP